MADRQRGFIARGQARDLGIRTTLIDSWIETGRLIRAWQTVYAVGHMPTEPRARAYGAMLAAGDGAAIAGMSAAAFYGATWRWPDPFELIASRQCRVAGLTLRQSSTLLTRDVWRFEGLRVTSPARTALDIASRVSPEQLKRMVNSLRLNRPARLTLPQCADILVRNPRHPGAAPLRELLGQSGRHPTRSDLERRVWPRFAAAHHLPAYEQNATVGGHEVDVLFAGLLVLEIDTVTTHLLNFESDRQRDREILARTGIPVLRITDVQIHDAPDQTAADILSALAQRRATTGTAPAAKPPTTPPAPE